MAARSRRRDLLSGAQAAVHVSEDATSAIRTFAVACGTTRPEAATIKAIRAVLERLDGKYQSDKAAWEANGASRSAFQHWKRTINLHLVDELDTASVTAMSVALNQNEASPAQVHPVGEPDLASPPPSSPASDGIELNEQPAAVGPEPKITKIEVTGMCCQSEVALIQRKLAALPGVGNLSISLMTRQVTVTHDPEQTPPEKLVRTLNWSLLGASLVTGDTGFGIKRGRWSWEAVLAVAVGLLWLPSFGIWTRAEGTDWRADPFSWTALACVAVGSPVMLARALSGVVFQRTLNMFATMAIATAGACAIRDFWEAATIVFFFAGSEALQARARAARAHVAQCARASCAAPAPPSHAHCRAPAPASRPQAWCVHHTADKAAGLGGLLPDEVSPADGGPAYPLSEVRVGAELLVKPGGRVPVDGTVVSGSSSVDESMLTGEGGARRGLPRPAFAAPALRRGRRTPTHGPSRAHTRRPRARAVPVLKGEGARVYAGTSNQSGALVVRTGALPSDCTAAQLTQLVGRSQSEQGRRAAQLESFTKLYTRRRT